jgi:hypothetical protein
MNNYTKLTLSERVNVTQLKKLNNTQVIKSSYEK